MRTKKQAEHEAYLQEMGDAIIEQQIMEERMTSAISAMPWVAHHGYIFDKNDKIVASFAKDGEEPFNRTSIADSMFICHVANNYGNLVAAFESLIIRYERLRGGLIASNYRDVLQSAKKGAFADLLDSQTQQCG